MKDQETRDYQKWWGTFRNNHIKLLEHKNMIACSICTCWTIEEITDLNSRLKTTKERTNALEDRVKQSSDNMMLKDMR